MAKYEPLKTIEFDPMAWRVLSGPRKGANEDGATPVPRIWPPRPTLWVALIACAALWAVYSTLGR